MAVTFGGETIDVVEGISYSQRPHKVKQTLGKRVTQHEIIGSDSKDYAIEISGRIVRSTEVAVKTAVSALNTVNDGAKHAYADSSDTTYDGNYVIETGSLVWDRQINPLSRKFSMRLVQW